MDNKEYDKVIENLDDIPESALNNLTDNLGDDEDE